MAAFAVRRGRPQASFIVSLAGGMIRVWASLLGSPDFDVVRLKNKIGKCKKPYNLHVNLVYKPAECEDPILCEVQFYAKAVFDLQHRQHLACELRRATSVEDLFPGFPDCSTFLPHQEQRVVVPGSVCTPLDATAWECMSKRASKLDMHRISAAMNGRTCRKRAHIRQIRRSNLTCAYFSGQEWCAADATRTV